MIPEGDRRNGAACFCRAIEMARSRNAESWAECTKERMPGRGGKKEEPKNEEVNQSPEWRASRESVKETDCGMFAGTSALLMMMMMPCVQYKLRALL